ncbi:MAG: hypothetical protein HFG38_12790 [Eubacterium sp.]|nr:hypothetical protein [Eubacterium sp.]
MKKGNPNDFRENCGCQRLIKAIDRYIEKADNDLSKTLDDTGFAKPEDSVEAIADLEDRLAEVLTDQTTEIAKTMLAAGDLTAALKVAEEFFAEDETRQRLAEALKEFYEENVPTLSTVYIREAEDDMVVSQIRQRTTSWIQSWSDDLADLMQLTSKKQLETIISGALEKGKGVEDLKRQLTVDGIRNEEYRARATSVTEMLRAHSVAKEEAIQQSPATDRKGWRHSGGHRIAPRENHVAMDGQIVAKERPFILIGRNGSTYHPMFPRDPNLPAEEVINCHCTHIPIVNDEVLGMSLEERQKLQQQIIDEDDRAWEKELDARNKAKAGIKDTENEIPRTEKLKPLEVDKAAVTSNAYKKMVYNAVDEMPKVKRSVRDSIGKIYKHRSGTDNEDLYFINSSTGSVRTSTRGTEPGTCAPTKPMKKMLANAEEGTIIGIHNHPRNSAPSVPDIMAAARRKYKYGIVACHDGTLYKYKVTGKVNEMMAESLLALY